MIGKEVVVVYEPSSIVYTCVGMQDRSCILERPAFGNSEFAMQIRVPEEKIRLINGTDKCSIFK